MSENSERNIVYVGADLNYWNELKNRFQNRYPDIEFKFSIVNPNDFTLYQRAFVHLFDIQPDIIYVDVAYNVRNQIKLCKLIKQEPLMANSVLVALVENTENLNIVWATKANFVHIKCGEYHDVVYDPFLVKWEKEAVSQEFAKAKTKLGAILIDQFRVAYITPTSMHVEGDIELKEGQVVDLQSAIPKDVIPSSKFIVKKVDTHDLYYDMRYSYDLDFVFVDKPQIDPDIIDKAEAERRLSEQMLSYEQYLKKVKRRNYEWVVDHMNDTAPKKTKVLIIDETLKTFRTSENAIDRFKFVVKLRAALSDNMEELNKYRPHIIAFQYPDIELPEEYKVMDEDIKQKKIDELKQILMTQTKLLGSVIDKVKTIENYEPVILVFNCKSMPTVELQKKFDYKLILSNSRQLSVHGTIELAEVFEKKQNDKADAQLKAAVATLKASDPVKNRNVTPDSLIEKRFYIKKDHKLSFVEMRLPIEITMISETELTFETEEVLQLGNFKITHPTEFGVGLILQDGKVGIPQNNKFSYHGMIHSIGEQGKREIRKYVNEVFTASVKETESLEAEEFKKLNDRIKSEKEQRAIEEKAEAEKQEKLREESINAKLNEAIDLATEEAEAESEGEVEKDLFGFVKKK